MSMVIITRKFNATDTKGERISAWVRGEWEHTRKVVGYDYSLSVLDAHMEAAEAVAGRPVAWTGESTPTGYLWRVAE